MELEGYLISMRGMGYAGKCFRRSGEVEKHDVVKEETVEVERHGRGGDKHGDITGVDFPCMAVGTAR